MRKFWKVLKWILAVIAAFLVLDLAVILFFSFYRPPLQKADAIVVLGAAINTPASYNRSLEGLKLYQQGDAPVIVLTGGVDYPHSAPEAVYMQQVILDNATTVPNMLLDVNAKSTFENLQNTKTIDPTAKSIIIVSDGFHLARSVLTAKRLDFGPVYWASPTPAYYNWRELSYYYGREVVAMVDYLPKFVVGK